jgi:hypothetical protein
VVSLDLDRVLHAFKVVSPLLQTSDDSKHLSIMDLTVALDVIQCLGQECNQVPCFVVMQLLGEYCTSCNARAVGFKSEWKVIVREY